MSVLGVEADWDVVYRTLPVEDAGHFLAQLGISWYAAVDMLDRADAPNPFMSPKQRTWLFYLANKVSKQ